MRVAATSARLGANFDKTYNASPACFAHVRSTDALQFLALAWRSKVGGSILQTCTKSMEVSRALEKFGVSCEHTS